MFDEPVKGLTWAQIAVPIALVLVPVVCTVSGLLWVLR